MEIIDNRILAERFHEYFAVEFATTAEKKQRAYRLRYRVYCDEFKFLPEDDYPDELEWDSFDDGSYHCLITHKSSNFPAGTVRIVPAVTANGDWRMPFELLGPDILDTQFVSKFDGARDQVGEISRLAVDSAFRRRSGEAATRFGEIDALDLEHIERRTFNLIALAAFLASAAMGELFGLRYGFAMMEPFLPRLMKRSGIQFEKIGLDIDYHGIRAPYFIQLETMMTSMKPDLKIFYSTIFGSLEKSLGRS